MPVNHNIIHYAIGAAAISLASYGALKTPPVTHVAAIHQLQKPSRFDWDGLGQDKTNALGDALNGAEPGRVTIFCDRPACHDLQLDLDDAMQLAGWQSQFETRFVDSEADRGIFVGPPGEDAQNLATAIKKTTGLQPAIVGIDGIDGVGIIIGKVVR